MAKTTRVSLFGTQNRSVFIDAKATKGSTVGDDLKWPDGTVVQESEIRGGSTVIESPTGVGGISLTLWSLIQAIPAFIQSLVSLTGTGLVVKGSFNAALVRTITPEDERITVVNGDGVAGNPTIGSTDWPVVKNSIIAGEEYTVPTGFQLLVWNSFVYDGGNLILDGDLIVL